MCRAPYSLAPPDPRWSTRLWQILRGLGGAACVSLLAFGLAGPPWPHLALLALVLLSTRSHGLLAVALLAAGTLLAALHVRGLRLMMRFDEAGRVGVAVVRHGAPVQGLGPGTLLVASDDLDHSLFRRSVVLIYEHGEGRGAKGVILNQPMGSPPEYVAGGGPDGADGGFNLTESVGRRGPAPKHFLGGPVGMPGEGIRQELAVLHTIGGVDGATVVLPPAGGRPELFQGGRLADVLELSEAGARGRRVGAPSRDQRVLVFHGISTWAEGQLEGEIRAGAWAYGSACHEDILHADPDQLWGVLLGSSRVTWLG